ISPLLLEKCAATWHVLPPQPAVETQMNPVLALLRQGDSLRQHHLARIGGPALPSVSFSFEETAEGPEPVGSHDSKASRGSLHQHPPGEANAHDLARRNRTAPSGHELHRGRTKGDRPP